MPYFSWTGVDQTGNKVDGIYFANDTEHLTEQLIEKQIIILQAKKKRQTKFNATDFLRNLLNLLKAGLSITEALYITKEKSSDHSLTEYFLMQLAKGHTLSKIMQNLSSIFNPLIINLVKIGEQSGTLENQLYQIILYQEHYKKLQQKIKNALTYPTIVTSLTIILLIIMCCFVIPKFQIFFDSMNGKLPIFTQIVMLLAEKSKFFFINLICITLILFCCWKIAGRKNKIAQEYLWRICMFLPIINRAIRFHLFSLLLRTLATTLKAGVPLIEALKMTTTTISQPTYHKALLEINARLQHGHSLTNILTNSSLFNVHIKQLLSLGEQTGKLDEMCDYLANYYFIQLQDFTKRLSILVEPIITIILSVIIGTITIALYLPLFSLGGLF